MCSQFKTNPIKAFEDEKQEREPVKKREEKKREKELAEELKRIDVYNQYDDESIQIDEEQVSLKSGCK